MKKPIIEIQPVTKWNGFRDWVAWKLVDLARRIRPESDSVKAYFMEKILEYQLMGMKYGDRKKTK